MIKDITDFLTGLFGSRHDRAVKKMEPMVDQINAVYERLHELPEDELRGQTDKLKEIVNERTEPLEEELEELRQTKRVTEDAVERDRLAAEVRDAEDELKEVTEAVLDEIMPEAFATVKEACRRLLGKEIVVTGTEMEWDMVPYDVQLVGAVALHQGKAAEMATGEGKTLAATMPLYLNALAGRGAHLVTVNSYLAERDAEWMGTVYEYLGLTVDCVDRYKPGSEERREAYHADITYGTNNEYGFDYLRDNMVHTLEQRVQRDHFYAILDEVDSILIDEARTPLIISGPVQQEQSDIYRKYDPAVQNLYRRQTRIVNELIGEAEKDLEEERFDAAGEKLLAAKRGGPKNKRLLKLFAEDPSIQKLVQDAESIFMRDKRMPEVDELLLFAMDEKGANVSLSDQGLDVLSPEDPEAFIVPDLSVDVGEIQDDPDLSVDEKRERIEGLEHEFAEKSQKIHAIHQLLKAYTLFHRDERYIVDDGQVVIVDEFTGRKMPGRRWSDGLHQAVEAKEGVDVRGETQTLATITIQNYFRMYDKLAGMTGTAETEESEFHEIYGLDVMVIPTNEPVIRDDRNDLIFRTKREKYNAILDEIDRLHTMQLPVLVGTVSVEVSETLSRMLKRRGIEHNVLNAKYHEHEAKIVAHAGQPGAVTIATNMAGRGTDIKLGPGVTDMRTVGWLREHDVDPAEMPYPADPALAETLEDEPDDYEVECGGLHIIGSSRHDSRRIDRQLRGRSGRQGDPGASQFFLSLEDDLMRLFGSDRIAGVMEKLGAEEGEVITARLVTKSIERAQKRVEMQNFEQRKRLLDYDDVMNQQREVIYDLRLFALEGGEDLKGEIWDMTRHAIEDAVADYAMEELRPEEWDLAALRNRLVMQMLLVVDELPEENRPDHPFDHPADIEELIFERAREAFDSKLEQFGDHRERLLAWILLSVIDDKWREHLYDLDHLKASIGFRGWGQKDPLIEYKKDAYDMFVGLMTDIRKSVASLVFKAQLQVEREPLPRMPQQVTLSGPSDTPQTRPERAQPAPQPVGAGAGAGGGNVPGAGAGATSGGAAAAGMANQLRQTSTNRGEDGGGKPEPVTVDEEPGRNDPCPCGSGKKYKKCHGSPV